jgi:hypothetical protein
MEMNRIIKWLFFCFLNFFCLLSFGQEKVEKFNIKSNAVQTEYMIEVVLPKEFSEEEKYPIIYCTDWYLTSGFLKSIYSWLEFGRSVESVILVGISVEKNAQDWSMNRYRDFTPTYPKDEYSIGYTYTPALEQTGGAENFATFIKYELIPFIESKYTSDTLRRGFIGYSLGGLFGTYILYSNADLFHYYLIGSPSLWWDSFSLINELKNSKLVPIKQGKIYLSVGENEDGVMLQGYGFLKDKLRRLQSDSIVLKTEIIKNEGHASGLPVSLYNGVRFLYGKK